MDRRVLVVGCGGIGSSVVKAAIAAFESMSYHVSSLAAELDFWQFVQNWEIPDLDWSADAGGLMGGTRAPKQKMAAAAARRAHAKGAW